MATPSKFEIILETGRQRYEKRAGKPLDQSLAIRLKTVADLRKHIEDQNGMFEAFRNKDKIIYARLNTVFMPIERLGNCVVTPISASSPPVGACFGAVAVLIKSAQDVSTHYDRIVELFEIMGGVMDRFELHDIDRITPQLEENYANVLATVLEMIAISTKAIERKRWKEYMLKILKGHDEQMSQLRKRLDQLVRDATSLVVEQINSSVGRIEAQSTSTNVHIERLGNHTKHIGLDVLDIKDSSREIMDILLQQHSTKRENDLYDILKPTQTNADRMEEISRQRVPDTGAWLLEEPAFQSWLQGSEPLLWICGSPGSGKTYLASSAITMLQAKSAGAADGWRSTAAGFFFFNKSEVGCMIGGFHQALRDVAWQITRFNADYTDHVTSQCRSWADIETVPSAWRKLITRYFSKEGRTLYLVFDGIDEAEEGGDRGRAAFLKLLPDITGKILEREGPDRPNIRILLLGRPHLSNSIRIAAYGQQTRMVTISVEAHKNRQDLRRYIERGVARLQLGGASTHLEKTIRDALEAKAQGMFLWVGLMLNILEVQSTEQEILDCLNRAPTDIEGMIREVLKVYSSTLKGREAEEFNTILAWISFAARPLTLAELDAVLRRSSPSGGPVLSLEAKLRERFGSIITLTRDDGLSTGMLQSRTKRLDEKSAYDSKYETTSVGYAHASIMEYFQKGEGKFAARKTYPKIGVVYAQAQPCILKLCLNVFVAPGENDRAKAAAILRTYARVHWYDHLQSSISRPFDAIDQLELLGILHSFLNEPDVLRGWCEDTPWTFYTEQVATVLNRCMEEWHRFDGAELDPTLLDWVESCINGRIELVFLPAAKIIGEQGLHRDGFGDDWGPLRAITSIAQIRALIEDDDTLDTLPDPPPLETLLKAVRWLDLEEDAVWNRKLAVCLRNLKYVKESIPYFERALQLDEANVREIRPCYHIPRAKVLHESDRIGVD
ncbi:hypothetical protein SLS60_008365 [Paraconiothyrium brasiliense]|uniref:NACHT domain-containing protein n=1 Tax=Paraconiothyrium brasiliense TaxID=300254 RepID=A0ABR3R0D9_9PLEO